MGMEWLIPLEIKKVFLFIYFFVLCDEMESQREWNERSNGMDHLNMFVMKNFKSK